MTCILYLFFVSIDYYYKWTTLKTKTFLQLKSLSQTSHLIGPLSTILGNCWYSYSMLKVNKYPRSFWKTSKAHSLSLEIKKTWSIIAFAHKNVQKFFLNLEFNKLLALFLPKPIRQFYIKVLKLMLDNFLTR